MPQYTFQTTAEEDVDTFIELPWQLNGHDPYWILSIRVPSTGTDWR